MGSNKTLIVFFGLLVLGLIAVAIFACGGRLPASLQATPEAPTSTPTALLVEATPLNQTGRTSSPTLTPTQSPTIPIEIAPSSTATSIPTATPAPITVMPPQGTAVATGLFAEVGCGAKGARVTFYWVPGSGPGSQQIDVSNFNNDFLYGTYRSSDVLAGEANSYLWDGLGDGVLYYWRVRKQTGQTWTPSETASVETLFCGGDISP